ncbi:unnamed protein product [Rotaria sp. Silwood2]|nr:unnamed protein product [Rotaria sp. Silwood2]
MSYCMRSFDLSSNRSFTSEKYVIHGTSITFEILKRKNITGEHLYLLSAPVDVVERYQEFLENSQSPLSIHTFNNCSEPWFGEYCQYSFSMSCTFNEIVSTYFTHLTFEINDSVYNGACYIFMKCNRGPSPSCLDWREVCDEKLDCLNDGRDEIDCDQLDMNECKDDEFRCSNGFCIPKELFNDDSLNPDCIDSSDEKYDETEDYLSVRQNCFKDPTFRCEEPKCRNERILSCGNGQCSMLFCRQDRDSILKDAKLSRNENLHISFECWEILICYTVTDITLDYFLENAECVDDDEKENRFREKCPFLFFVPVQPIVLNHVHFVYANNLTNRFKQDIFVPHYICYDQE